MSTALKDLSPRERVIVALDCGTEKALALADALQGKAVWVKVGMTLYYAQGPDIIFEMKRRGFKVFLDLKFHDIPAQVKGAAKAAVENGADMVTCHTVGGSEMMRAVAEGAAEAVRDFGLDAPATLGVTVLTSMDQDALAATGVSRPLADQVTALARLAKEAGLSGVVASPQEARQLRALLGPDAYIVTPGVRPAGASLDDQKRVATPLQAIENGSSHIVVGRPITKADDPVAAFEAIVESIS
ncbi:MAG: orotidine-5'-phosphate decarboxylase [Eggerthellaceae bacterium]|jgi:orotidine-5'-phosphate decarboxylase